MTTAHISKEIAAPPEAVFAVFTDFENAAENIRGIERLEVLTDGPIGIGTRFKETRRIFKREATEEMEITSYEPGRGYRVEAFSCGSEFRTDFQFLPAEAGTRVDVRIDCRPKSFFAKLMSPMGKLMMKGCVTAFDKDLEDLKGVAEAGSRATS